MTDTFQFKSLALWMIFMISIHTISAQNNNIDSVANDLLLSGESRMNQGEMDTAIHLISQSLELFTTMEGKARAEKSLSGAYFFSGKIAESTIHLNNALNLYTKLNDQESIGGILVNICMSLYGQERFEEAIEKCQKAVSIGENQKSSNILSRAYLMTGQGYQGIEKYDKALSYYKKAEPLVLGQENPSLKASFYNAKSATLYHKEMYQAALTSLSEAERIYKGLNFSRGLNETKRTKGKIFVALQNYGDAIPLLLENKKYFQEKRDLKSMSSNYKFLSLAYEGIKDYKSALSAQREFSTLKDSVLGEKRIEEISALEVEFDTQKKENEILKLQNANNAAALKSVKQKSLLTVSFILIGFIALLAYVFYNRIQIQKRLNALLKIKNEEIEKKNKMNQILVKEIHHRVKNNLQILSSLLSIQSNYIDDKVALEAMQEGQNRVKSMGLIHQKLYMGENIAAVDMKSFITDLTSYLISAFGKDNLIHVDSLIESVRLDVDTAIPLGLIINELVTNSLKYAFHERTDGNITIKLQEFEKNNLFLSVKDNGGGLLTGKNNQNSPGFGTDLVSILNKKLKGKIEQKSMNGFETTIKFQAFNHTAAVA